MKSITIHGLDDELDRLIRERATMQGLSLNKTIKSLLRESFNIAENRKRKREEFKQFFGTWSKKDYDEFVANTKDDERIDKEDWE